MKRKLLITLSFIILSFIAQGQTKSPAVFLGYQLGERFTPHHRIVDYFEHVAAHNDNVKLEYYGETFEKRPLMVVWVSAQGNIDQLEEIRMDNLRRTGLETGSPSNQIPITWLSYNVHGNEAVSSEAAMKTLWALVDPAKSNNKTWLQNNMVVIDPCVNPDGRDRYVNWYNQKMNTQLQPDIQSTEHQEPWPGGRANHYLFDLNRDWAWQTQQESQQRMALYQQWMPNIHLDFHEQGINSPYYFAPAAVPLHRQLSDYQLEFQETFGRQNAAYFDKNDWFYFTKEVFDLLYPSYGDTYPMFNGAIGMTIEQGGSGAAGIGVHTAESDTLTLKERIKHHHTTGLTAIEVTSKNASRLLSEFEAYFDQSPQGKYKSFVIKGDNSEGRITGLLALLDKNKIQYSQSGKSTSLRGYSYQKGKEEAFNLEKEDIIINAWQPKSVLTQVLFEPEAQLQDSLTYDITSWALPYAYGLAAYALEEKLEGSTTYPQPEVVNNEVDNSTLGYLVAWNDVKQATFLAELLQEGIRIRSAAYPFAVDGKSYPTGSLIITRGGNDYVKNFHQKVTQLANKHQITLGTASTGFMDSGKDFGSSTVRTIKAPKIAVFSGEGVSSLNFGEVWHFFEQQLNYPIAVLNASDAGHLNLEKYDVLILPSGSYNWENGEMKNITEWTKAGGKLIAIEGALELFVDKEGFGLSTFISDQQKVTFDTDQEEDLTSPYRDRERQAISNYAAGAVFEVDMDSTYSLGFGTGGKYYSLKNNPNRYSFLNNCINAGVIHSLDQHRAGFIGYKAKAKMKESLVFGVENMGKGQLIYLVDNPLFRSFWENGKLIMANAVFLVGN
ncbi:zinc carboxypeptidase [Echinicola strongylocentroti]|uniref:Zinc carboxypeptidase n=1 Tax=Echinicola strongylocentroti TaxID=1795355 RepID=A0A2Z4III4_9BACT|nr:M14 family zinc carboxypeptidase [Echinicola strongylocentroti]AWW30715.1 zinc carboxypeptidase [Echinicola strongylocentroti]